MKHLRSPGWFGLTVSRVPRADHSTDPALPFYLAHDALRLVVTVRQHRFDRTRPRLRPLADPRVLPCAAAFAFAAGGRVGGAGLLLGRAPGLRHPQPRRLRAPPADLCAPLGRRQRREHRQHHGPHGRVRQRQPRRRARVRRPRRAAGSESVLRLPGLHDDLGPGGRPAGRSAVLGLPHGRAVQLAARAAAGRRVVPAATQQCASETVFPSS